TKNRDATNNPRKYPLLQARSLDLAIPPHTAPDMPPIIVAEATIAPHAGLSHIRAMSAPNTTAPPIASPTSNAPQSGNWNQPSEYPISAWPPRTSTLTHIEKVPAPRPMWNLQYGIAQVHIPQNDRRQ